MHIKMWYLLLPTLLITKFFLGSAQPRVFVDPFLYQSDYQALHDDITRYLNNPNKTQALDNQLIRKINEFKEKLMRQFFAYRNNIENDRLVDQSVKDRASEILRAMQVSNVRIQTTITKLQDSTGYGIFAADEDKRSEALRNLNIFIQQLYDEYTELRNLVIRQSELRDVDVKVSRVATVAEEVKKDVDDSRQVVHEIEIQDKKLKKIYTAAKDPENIYVNATKSLMSAKDTIVSGAQILLQEVDACTAQVVILSDQIRQNREDGSLYQEFNTQVDNVENLRIKAKDLLRYSQKIKTELISIMKKFLTPEYQTEYLRPQSNVTKEELKSAFVPETNEKPTPHAGGGASAGNLDEEALRAAELQRKQDEIAVAQAAQALQQAQEAEQQAKTEAAKREAARKLEMAEAAEAEARKQLDVDYAKKLNEITNLLDSKKSMQDSQNLKQEQQEIEQRFATSYAGGGASAGNKNVELLKLKNRNINLRNDINGLSKNIENNINPNLKFLNDQMKKKLSVLKIVLDNLLAWVNENITEITKNRDKITNEQLANLSEDYNVKKKELEDLKSKYNELLRVIQEAKQKPTSHADGGASADTSDADALRALELKREQDEIVAAQAAQALQKAQEAEQQAKTKAAKEEAAKKLKMAEEAEAKARAKLKDGFEQELDLVQELLKNTKSMKDAQKLKQQQQEIEHNLALKRQDSLEGINLKQLLNDNIELVNKVRTLLNHVENRIVPVLDLLSKQNKDILKNMLSVLPDMLSRIEMDLKEIRGDQKMVNINDKIEAFERRKKRFEIINGRYNTLLQAIQEAKQKPTSHAGGGASAGNKKEEDLRAAELQRKQDEIAAAQAAQALQKAQEAEQQAKTEAAKREAARKLEMAEAAEAEARRKVEVDYAKGLNEITNLLDSKKSMQDSQNLKQEQQDLKQQQQEIEHRLATLEDKSLTKKFMDNVAQNASHWLKLLPQDKVVPENAVRNILGNNVTRAQVLYAQGFLQVGQLNIFK